MRRKPQPTRHDFPRHDSIPLSITETRGAADASKCQNLAVHATVLPREELWPPSCCGKQVFQRLGFQHFSPADSAKGKNSQIICSSSPFEVVYALRCSSRPQLQLTSSLQFTPPLQFTSPAAVYVPAVVYAPAAVYVTHTHTHTRCSLRPSPPLQFMPLAAVSAATATSFSLHCTSERQLRPFPAFMEGL